MNKFRFRLQKLLDVRTYKEKQIKSELAGAQIKRNTYLESKEKFLEEGQVSRNNMNKEKKDSFLTIDRFHQFQQYFKRLKANIKVQNKLIKLADDEIGLINTRLIEARKSKRIIERLKEKKQEQYDYEVQKEEQDFFDEVGNVSFVKKQDQEREAQIKEQVKEKAEIPKKYKEFKTRTEELYDEIVEKGELLL